jgi:hypothetical protein
MKGDIRIIYYRRRHRRSREYYDGKKTKNGETILTM